MPGGPSDDEREVARIVGVWALFPHTFPQSVHVNQIKMSSKTTTTYVLWGNNGHWGEHGVVEGGIQNAIDRYEKILTEQIPPGTSVDRIPDGMLFVSVHEDGRFNAIETKVLTQIELVNKSTSEDTNSTKFEQDNVP